MDALYIPKGFPDELVRFLEANEGDFINCTFCGAELEPDPFRGHSLYEHVGVCYYCAKRLTALFHYQHSGEFGGFYPSPYPRKAKRPSISRAMALRVIGRCGYKCVQCGAREPLEVDHIKPLAKGGEHTEDNMQALCATCNRSKGARYVAA